MWSADRSADRSRGGGLPDRPVSGWGLTTKQMRGNENSSRVSDRICTNILEASPRAMSMTILRKLLNTDRATLSPLCQEGQTAVRRMPRTSHVRHRLVRGSDSNNCVLSRLGAPLLQLFLCSICSLLSMFAFQVIRPCTCNKAAFWLKPSAWTAADMHKTILLPLWSCCHEAPLSPEGDF